MLTPSDYGIILEMIGFVLLLLTSGRNPNAQYRVTEDHKQSKFDMIRERLIPNKIVTLFLIIGISAIIIGLSFQFSFLTPK